MALGNENNCQKQRLWNQREEYLSFTFISYNYICELRVVKKDNICELRIVKIICKLRIKIRHQIHLDIKEMHVKYHLQYLEDNKCSVFYNSGQYCCYYHDYTILSASSFK